MLFEQLKENSSVALLSSTCLICINTILGIQKKYLQIISHPVIDFTLLIKNDQTPHVKKGLEHLYVCQSNLFDKFLKLTTSA